MMNLKTLWFAVWIGLAALAAGCAGRGVKPTPGSADLSDKSTLSRLELSREEAILRSKQIAAVSYILWFGLDGTNPDFEGRAVINFELRNRPKDLAHGVFVDFVGGKLSALKVNGNALENTAEHYDGRRIYLRGSEIQAGMNRLEISFTHPYGAGDQGLNRIVDPKDNAVYIYSSINPHGAHLVFPCFDQPDLRASFELTVETPEDWQVISNTRERDISKVDGRRSWAFPPSSKLSASVFALHAGPFSFKASDAQGVPLRIFVRKSEQDRLSLVANFKNWFDVTREGLDFFDLSFGYPYPYSKYDQVLLPELEPVTISSAGAVAISEKYLLDAKSSPKFAQKQGARSHMILHQLAHMWFGNLVTPRWWNSLWFYEGISDFMATWAESERNPGQLWATFLREIKRKAYDHERADGQRALEIPVADADSPRAGLGYGDMGKTSAVMKQLRYYLGEDEFRDGLQRFFIKNALRNAGVGEFLKSMAEASGEDLSGWHKVWLQTAGMNTVRAEWRCEEQEVTWKRKTKIISKISEFRLIQGGAVLRPHRTEVALFDFKGGAKFKPRETIVVTYSAAETPVRALVGKECPDFVFLNYNDQDYVRVELGPESLEAVLHKADQFSEPLTRQLLVSTVWDAFLDGKLSSAQYYEFATSYAKAEKDPGILDWTLETLAGVEVSGPLLKSFTFEEFSRLGTFLLKGYQATAKGTELHSVWRERLLKAPAQVLASPELERESNKLLQLK